MECLDRDVWDPLINRLLDAHVDRGPTEHRVAPRGARRRVWTVLVYPGGTGAAIVGTELRPRVYMHVRRTADGSLVYGSPRPSRHQLTDAVVAGSLRAVQAALERSAFTHVNDPERKRRRVRGKR